jgi:4-amino-4-deoxy-L-arabinose transferase-like glycosyltransferase
LLSPLAPLLTRPFRFRRVRLSLPARLPVADAVYRLALVMVITGAAALSLTWVFRVPIYQNPDEPANFDYAMSIRTHGGLFVLHHSSYQQLPGTVHPWTAYLMDRTDTARIAFRSDQRAPLGYGTAAFFQAIDRDAPDLHGVNITTPNRPYAVYPFGYYATLAAWMQLLSFWSDRPVFLFFSCRVFSVMLLVASLSLLHATLRRMHVGRWFALALTASVAFFPMTTFVSASIQMDNLSFALVSACFYLAIRARQENYSERTLALLGLALGGLLVTKQHFFLAVTAGTTPMLVVGLASIRPDRARLLRTLTWLIAPALITGAINVRTSWGTVNYYFPAEKSRDLVSHTISKLNEAIGNLYAGSTHISFVGVFGWLDAPLIIHGGRTTELIRIVFGWATWLLVGLTLLRLEQVVSRLGMICRQGHWRRALSVAVSNPVIITYFIFTIILIAIYIRTDNRFGAQGRNWFPLWLPMILIATVYAPRALRLRVARRALSAALVAAMLFFAAVGSFYGLRTIDHRYYAPPRPTIPMADADTSGGATRFCEASLNEEQSPNV